MPSHLSKIFLLILIIGIGINTQLSNSTVNDFRFTYPQSQLTTIEWIGDLPSFPCNLTNNSYTQNALFSVSWDYYTNNTVGFGWINAWGYNGYDYDIYINNESNMIIETARIEDPPWIPVPWCNGIIINGILTNWTNYGDSFLLLDYPQNLTINLTEYNIAFESSFDLIFRFQNYYNGESYIIYHYYYANKPVIPIIIPQMIEYSYMIAGGLISIGFISIYYYYQSKITKKEQNVVRYEYDE